MRSRRLTALAVALPLVVLGGCGDGDNPKPKPYDPPTTSASPTSSTTPEAETPEAFIRRWVGADTKMQNTGDTAPYLALTTNCATCKAFAKQIAGIYEAGGYVHTKGWIVKSVVLEKGGAADEPTYLITVDDSPTTYAESKGGQVEHLSGGHSRHNVFLVRTAQGWTVQDYTEKVS